jgi:hypothetical protein
MRSSGPAVAASGDWTETSTHHVPGIQPTEVRELLEHSPEVVVLSRGRGLRLQTTPETLDLLETRGVRVV